MDEEQNDKQSGNDIDNVEVKNSSSLDDAKKRALEALVPLLGELKDIGPERKFDICINALRFTDSKDMVVVALESALAIEDKGTKAEALVELVNEINYLEKS